MSILTINGSVNNSRYVMRPKTIADKEKLVEREGSTVVVPMDCYLGVRDLPFKMTPAVMIEVAYWAQNQASFDAAEEVILKTTGLKVSDDNVRMVANKIGGYIHAIDQKRAEECHTQFASGNIVFPRKKKKGVLYIEVDGASINTRKKDTSGSSWRENKLGIVFSSDNIRSWRDKKGEPQHEILKREYTSFIGGVSEFQKLVFACALKNGYGEYEKTLILGDGASWIRSMRDELFPDALLVLDFYHMCENVYTFAKHAFSYDESKYAPWAETMTDHFRKSESGAVLAALDMFSESVHKTAKINLRGYIDKNKDSIDYATYAEKGYFIGSGAIESGNKVVMQKRCKQAGMRWNVPTAQTILTLRAKKESGLWQREVVEPVLAKYNEPIISMNRAGLA